MIIPQSINHLDTVKTVRTKRAWNPLWGTKDRNFQSEYTTFTVFNREIPKMGIEYRKPLRNARQAVSRDCPPRWRNQELSWAWNGWVWHLSLCHISLVRERRTDLECPSFSHVPEIDHVVAQWRIQRIYPYIPASVTQLSLARLQLGVEWVMGGPRGNSCD